jgi:hypothetical protein
MWRINLGPQLAMGLDFDLERQGSIVGELVGRTSGAAELEAELWLIQGDEDNTLLATAQPAALTLDLQAPTAFAFTLTPTPEAEYVPYAPGQNLQLRLTLTTESPCCAPQSPPTLLVEPFEMKLGLNEYHEAPVINEEGREIIATIEATPEGAIEKRARPGSTMTYAYNVKNTADTPVDVLVEPEGTGKDLLTIIPGLRFSLDAGDSTRVLVGVKVPADANDGEILEGVLVLRAADDPANLAIARTSTVVTTSGDALPDESNVLAQAQGEGEKGLPTPGVAAILSVIAVLALARRARRSR